MSFAHTIMRRVQWARFTSTPVVLTPKETLSLLFGYVSDSDYDYVDNETSFWHTNQSSEYANSNFMIEEEDWGLLYYDPKENRWHDNAKGKMFYEKLDQLRKSDLFRKNWYHNVQLLKDECRK